MTTDDQRIENWTYVGPNGPTPAEYDIEFEDDQSLLDVAFSNAVSWLHEKGADKVEFDITDGEHLVHVEIIK